MKLNMHNKKKGRGEVVQSSSSLLFCFKGTSDHRL